MIFLNKNCKYSIFQKLQKMEQHFFSANGTKIFDSDVGRFVEFWFAEIPQGEISRQSFFLNAIPLAIRENDDDDEDYEDTESVVKIAAAIKTIKTVSFRVQRKCDQDRIFEKILPFLSSVKKNVSGALYFLIQLIENNVGVFDIVQAPSKWKCSICMDSKDSHMCIKTVCGHFFHHACYIKFMSPICPLCRQDIV